MCILKINPKKSIKVVKNLLWFRYMFYIFPWITRQTWYFSVRLWSGTHSPSDTSTVNIRFWCQVLPFTLMFCNHTGGVHHRETHIQILPYFDHTSNVIISRDTSLYSLHSDVGDYRAGGVLLTLIVGSGWFNKDPCQWVCVFISWITFQLSILVVTDWQQDAGLPHIHSWQLTDTSPVLC